MTLPVRAHHVGSLLRPASLRAAYRRHRRGEIGDDEFRGAQDEAIRDAVAMQEDLGLRVVTDGELRRTSYWSAFVAAVDGLEVVPGTLRPGQMVVYRLNTPHGSPPNATDQIREAFLITFNVPGIRLDPRAELVAVCDPNEELLKKRQTEWGVENVTTTFEDIAEDPDVDAVIIATPNFTHKPIALACIDAATGKVVWRETPEWPERLGGREEVVGPYRGALLAVDGQFLCIGELGHLMWMDLSPKGYKEVSRTWLFAARETWCPPVVSRGLLYVAQNTRDLMRASTPRLLCYDMRA